MTKSKICPLCGESFIGQHVCNKFSTFNKELLSPAMKIAAKTATSDEGEEYREAGTEDTEIPEYSMCDLCLKVKRLDLLTEIKVAVPEAMAVMTGDSVYKPLACPACLKEANEE